MFNIHKIEEEKDISSAGKITNDEYVDAPTKAIVFHYEFLQNTSTPRTLAHILTQFGSLLQIKDKEQGLIADYAQIADLYYYLWYLNKMPPKIQGHSSDDDVGAVTLAHWFGHPLKPYQGLNASGLSSKLQSPASANNIDGDLLTILQLTQPKAKYTEFLKHEEVAFTCLSGQKMLPLFITPRNKKILLLMLHQATPRDDSTTNTISIDSLEFYADGVKRIGELYADFLINLFAPAHAEAGRAYEPDTTFLSNYMPIDFTKLNGGHPLIPSEVGIKRTLKLNIGSTTTDAVRLNQYSLLRA